MLLQWEVGRLALHIMHKLLVCHEISAEDFTEHQYKLPQGDIAIVPHLPGHIVLEHMLRDSPLLKKVCFKAIPSFPADKRLQDRNVGLISFSIKLLVVIQQTG